MSKEKKEQQEINAIIGLDAGNNSIKIVSSLENGQEIFTDFYENVYCRTYGDLTEIDYGFKKAGSKNKENIPKKYDKYLDVSVQREGKEVNNFIFGRQSDDYKSSQQQRSNIYKTGDAILIDSSIVCMVNSIIKHMKPEELKSEMKFNIKMAAGLPYKECETTGKDKFQEEFEGTHTIMYNNPMYPLEKSIVTISKPDIDIEGLAALYDNDDLADMVASHDKTLSHKKVILVDIGCYSVDIIVGKFDYDRDEDELEFEEDYNLSIGIPLGVGTATDNIIKEIIQINRNELPQNVVISRKDIDEAAELEEKILLGTNISIEPFYTEKNEALAYDIANRLSEDMLAKGLLTQQIEKIFLAGGGAKKDVITNKFIQTVMKKLNLSEDKFKILDEPVFANARGYYTMAYCATLQ